MKLSAMIVTLAVSSSAFASLKDLTFTNLPTASKTYSKALNSESDLIPVTDALRGECLVDKAAAEAFIVKSDSKIFVSEGCTIRVTPGYDDQGGSAPTMISTGFKVQFK